jgi:SPP1 gp7 family putative phage head morphogenesis protein
MADAVTTAADRLTPALRRALARAFALLTARVPLEDLARAVDTGRLTPRLDAALRALPALLRAEVSPVIAAAVRAGAQASAAAIAQAARSARTRATVPPSAFRQVNARAVERAASKATASLVRAASAGTRQAVRVAVRDAVAGVEGKASAQAAARTIRGVVGLDPRRATAVTRYRARLIKQGADPARASAQAERYAGRLLAQRATTIARTEIIGAANDGRLAAWRAAQDKGLLKAGQRRVWVVTPDDRLCPSCEAMDGQTVDLGEPFESDDFGTVDAPPLHPNCRCTTVLEKS